jgi:hypothetical protein
MVLFGTRLSNSAENASLVELDQAVKKCCFHELTSCVMRGEIFVLDWAQNGGLPTVP